jgi:hypothetical protein
LLNDFPIATVNDLANVTQMEQLAEIFASIYVEIPAEQRADHPSAIVTKSGEF